MATVAGLTVPARSFALAGTLTAVPDATFVCESTVAAGDDLSAPLLRATGGSRTALDEALAADDSVASFSCLSDRASEHLYHVEWADAFGAVVGHLTGSLGTILEARASGTEWTVRVLYPDRDALSAAHERCERNGVSVDVDHVTTLDPSERTGASITNEQREALLAACERGYFDIPRRVGLRELAADLDISHQALSERLRRGHDSLITETLADGEELTL